MLFDELTPKSRPARHTGRYPCTNFAVELAGGIDANGKEVKHPAVLSIAYDINTGRALEVICENRGKVGQGIDILLHDVSIKFSRMLQDRDPQTGELLYVSNDPRSPCRCEMGQPCYCFEEEPCC